MMPTSTVLLFLVVTTTEAMPAPGSTRRGSTVNKLPRLRVTGEDELKAKDSPLGRGCQHTIRYVRLGRFIALVGVKTPHRMRR